VKELQKNMGGMAKPVKELKSSVEEIKKEIAPKEKKKR
jgi:hypothetical protein